MAKLFFLVSGEYESLSFSELLAILETEGYRYQVTERLRPDPAFGSASRKHPAGHAKEFVHPSLRTGTLYM